MGVFHVLTCKNGTRPRKASHMFNTYSTYSAYCLRDIFIYAGVFSVATFFAGLMYGLLKDKWIKIAVGQGESFCHFRALKCLVAFKH